MDDAPSRSRSLSPQRAAGSVLRLIRRVASQQGGVASTELALLTPVIVYMLAATFDFGLCGYREMQVQSAAQAGAQYAILHGYDSTIANVVTGATSYSGIAAAPAPTKYCGCASSSGVAATECDSVCPNGANPGTFVTVSSSATYSTVMPYPMVPSAIALLAKATVRIR